MLNFVSESVTNRKLFHFIARSIQKFAPDLKAQIDVFENQKEDEEEEECVTQGIEEINLCSHLSLFTRIFQNVMNLIVIFFADGQK